MVGEGGSFCVSQGTVGEEGGGEGRRKNGAEVKEVGGKFRNSVTSTLLAGRRTWDMDRPRTKLQNTCVCMCGRVGLGIHEVGIYWWVKWSGDLHEGGCRMGEGGVGSQDELGVGVYGQVGVGMLKKWGSVMDTHMH